MVYFDCSLLSGRPTGSLPELSERQANFRMVQGSVQTCGLYQRSALPGGGGVETNPLPHTMEFLCDCALNDCLRNLWNPRCSARAAPGACRLMTLLLFFLSSFSNGTEHGSLGEAFFSRIADETWDHSLGTSTLWQLRQPKPVSPETVGASYRKLAVTVPSALLLSVLVIARPSSWRFIARCIEGN